MYFYNRQHIKYMTKKLTFHKKYIKPCFTPYSKIDFQRREKYSKKIHQINLIIFSALFWILMRKLISNTAIVFFEYNLWRLIELWSSISITSVFIIPLSKKISSFNKSLYTNFFWFIIQIGTILYLIKNIWLWMGKIEHKIEQEIE